MTDAAPEQPNAEPRPVNLSALLGEALSKSGLLWIEVPGDRAWPAWHAWHDNQILVVSGPGEQHLPWLPETVHVILRSKDHGGRLLTVAARARTIAADSPEWAAAAEALRGERLNATDDVLARWAAHGTIHALTPFGAPVEAPGSMGSESGRAPLVTSPATSTGWRPWHFRGRPQRRRRQH